MNTDRPWTTLWDRPNRRVLLLAGRDPDQHHWLFIRHDATSSAEDTYDLWRDSEGNIVFVEIHLDENDIPRGFPQDLLDERLLGSMTIWPHPDLESFIWWHDRHPE
jgi:hypothetical protein